MRIAVVGGGISGVVSSYILSREHQVDLFESNSRLGGHTNTVKLDRGPDQGVAIDTGFIVLNNKNYPLMHRFLNQLSVDVRWSEMSFGYSSDAADLEYSGKSISSMFCDRRNLVRPRFYNFLFEISNFCKHSLSDLETGKLESLTLGEYVKGRYSEYFLDHYLVPMAAAIWSSPDQEVYLFPAKSFVSFFKHHGLLSLADRPKWQTIQNGSHSYLEAFKKSFNGEVILSEKLKSVLPKSGQSELVFESGRTGIYDKVVLAVHADQAREILSNDYHELLKVLKDWRYQSNKVVLHSDSSVMPSNKRSWSSWNYRRMTNDKKSSDAVFVSYYMNHLQGLSLKNDYFVTLNSPIEIEQTKIFAEVNFEHPVFTKEVINTEDKLIDVNGEHGVYLAGAYTGNGFHEDGVRSAVKVGQKFGIEL